MPALVTKEDEIESFILGANVDYHDPISLHSGFSMTPSINRPIGH
jgi:hypothetical protein